MIDDVKLILSTPYEELINSSKVLVLLNVYSKLYLNGAQPGTCGQCYRDAFKSITNNGMELAEKYEEAKARTCKPVWNGLKYIPSTARHWNSELLTDKDAIYLLEGKHVKESDFEVLPISYGKPVSEEKIQQEFQKRHTPRKKKV